MNWKIKKNKMDNDLIGRQAAIEIIKNYCENGCDIAEDNWCPSCQREKFVELLKALPSAQPETIRPAWKADNRYVKTMFQPFPYCPKCNHYLINGDSYCSVCGRHIDWRKDDE